MELRERVLQARKAEQLAAAALERYAVRL